MRYAHALRFGGQLVLIAIAFGASAYCGYLALAHESTASPPSADGGLAVDTQEVDFGEVKQHQKLHHRFTITNRSPDVMVIQDVGTSCGCTASELSSKELAPGASATLDVRWETQSTRGRAAQVVGVRYSRSVDEEPVSLTLTLRADVRPPVLSSTDRIVFDRRQSGRQSITFRRADAKPLSITSSKSNQDAVRVVPESNTLHVTFDPAAYRPESGLPVVTVWTDCAEESVIQIPVGIRE
jgi:hypothetical protein